MLQKLGVSLPQLAGPPQVSHEHLTWATAQVNLFFGSFRRAEADDPETFTAGCLRLFTAYPPQAVQYVVDPVTGLPGQSEWLPPLKKVRDALEAWEAEQERQREIVRRHEAAERQIREREVWLAKQNRKPTLDELRAKYCPNWGLSESSASDDKLKARRREIMQKANQRAFVAECQDAGIDPAGGVSPSLIARLNEQRFT